jgi:hypothetical protein
MVMTFLDGRTFAGGQAALLRGSWEGEIFGVGLFEALVDAYPEHSDVLTACATMEWLNVHLCEDPGHDAGIHVSVGAAEKLGNAGAEFARTLRSFRSVAKVAIAVTPPVDLAYERLRTGAKTPELTTLADDLLAHENAVRDWLRSELHGSSDGGDQVFTYLARHGITRDEATTPRQRREEMGGDRQHLVLASFDDEAAADLAAETLRN